MVDLGKYHIPGTKGMRSYLDCEICNQECLEHGTEEF